MKTNFLPLITALNGPPSLANDADVELLLYVYEAFVASDTVGDAVVSRTRYERACSRRGGGTQPISRPKAVYLAWPSANGAKVGFRAIHQALAKTGMGAKRLDCHHGQCTPAPPGSLGGRPTR